MIGPLFLYSTSPAPHEATILASAQQRQPVPAATVSAVVLQTALPTPSDAELSSLRRHFCTQGVDVDLRDSGIASREDAEHPAVVERLAAADLVLITGGSPDLLYDRTAGTAALAALRNASERGAVIAGCSAGAVVFGAGMAQRTDGAVVARRMWGWLPRTLVAPHFGNYDIDPWFAAFPACRVLGIPDDAMALVTNGRDVQQIGARAVQECSSTRSAR